MSHANAEFYQPTEEEIKKAQVFANLNGENFNGVQRIDFLKIKNNIYLSELEDDSPYMAIEALNENQRKKFIDDFKTMVYDYYDKINQEKESKKKRELKRESQK